MINEILIAILVKRVEERFAALPDSSPLRGPRGQRGAAGRDGKDFNFDEHAETFRAWAKEFAIKFEDFTPEQLDAIRGARGRDGRDGKDFVYHEHREEIVKACKDAVESISENLKLRFSDLSSEDIEQLRGARGRDGRNGKDGKDFNFEEHRSYFDSLKPKFSDFTPDEVDQLKLRFSHLSASEKDSLKLRFTDLTEEDRLSLRGPRGSRGQRGVQGERGQAGVDGKDGQQGPRGLPGIPGVLGRSGRDGRDGEDGEDAPYVTDIVVDEIRVGEVEFKFEFSDGTAITTNAVKLPRPNVYNSAGGVAASAGSGSGGGSGTDGKSAYEVAVDNGFVGTEQDWLDSLVGPAGPTGPAGSDGVDGADGATGPAGPAGPPGTPGGVTSFQESITAADTVAVDAIEYDDFAAAEFSIALKMGTTRSFMKLVVQKSEGDPVDEFVEWDEMPDVDGLGAIVEKVWESSVTLDLDVEATVLDDGMNLIFTNNEGSTVQVSGTRTLVPDFV